MDSRVRALRSTAGGVAQLKHLGARYAGPEIVVRGCVPRDAILRHFSGKTVDVHLWNAWSELWRAVGRDGVGGGGRDNRRCVFIGWGGAGGQAREAKGNSNQCGCKQFRV